jgi:hypothetical protein
MTRARPSPGPYVEEEHDELINTGGRYATLHRGAGGYP